jgi:site-specific DNA recombinase
MRTALYARVSSEEQVEGYSTFVSPTYFPIEIEVFAKHPDREASPLYQGAFLFCYKGGRKIDRLYRRVSTEEQKEGTSLEWQLAKLAEMAPNAIDYCDAGYTGTNGNRPGLLRLINETQPGDRMLVWKLDRLARNLRLLLEIEAKLRDMKVPLISITESIDTSTAFGRMIFQILGVVGEWEREAIVERTKSGRYARYKEGKWGPGHTLYGYRYNPETKGLDIREDEASVVRRIYNLYVFDNHGIEQIARLLNLEGIHPRNQTKMWGTNSIRAILMHPGYKDKHPNGVKLAPISLQYLWNQAQKRRHENPPLHRRRESPWLLQAIMHCGLCGHILSCKHQQHARRAYRCAGRLLGAHPDDSHKCKLPGLDAEWLEDAVFKTVMDTLSKPEGMVKAINVSIQISQARRNELEYTIKPIEAKLKDVDKRLAKLADDWVVGALGEADVNQRRGRLEAEKQRLLSIKAEIHPNQIDELAHVKERLKLYTNELELIKAGKVDGAFYHQEIISCLS